jgi:hypothetical protein
MNIKIIQQLMPWELDHALFSFSQLKKSKKHIGPDINITIDTALNLSDFTIDWEQSKLPKSFFIEKYNSLSFLLNDYKHNSFVYEGDQSFGHLDLQKSSTQADIDYYIYICPDMYFSEYLLYYMTEAVNNIPEKTFVVTPQVTKRWDASWDVLVNGHFMSTPYHKCFDVSCFEIDEINAMEPSLQRLDTYKYAGWFDCYSKDVWETYCPVWEEWCGYGSWDTYSAGVLQTINHLGVQSAQYVIRNQVISEHWNGSYPQQMWGIDEYKDKNSNILSQYYKNLLALRNFKHGDLIYSKLPYYVQTQVSRLIESGIVNKI